MDQNSRIELTPTEDLESVKVFMEGNLSYDDVMNMNLLCILEAVNTYVKNTPDEHKEGLLRTVYDDINLRFTQALSIIIPDEALPVDFTEEAQKALADEDKYIELKFKADQYDELMKAVGKTGKLASSVRVDEKGKVLV